MRINKIQNSNYKTVVLRTHSLSLWIGLTIFALLSSCISSPPRSTPKPTSTPESIYFVDSDLGSDVNPGSQAQPWKTIQKAANTAFAGDTVMVIAGNYAERVNVTRAGIVFQANGHVTMQGFTISANNVTVNGFYITDTPGIGNDGHGFYISGSNCVIENNHIYYATRGGIRFTPSTSGCIVKNNKFERNSQYGIEIHGTNHLVEGNEIWGTIQYHPTWTNPPDWVDADGISFFGSGHIIRNNYIHDIYYGIPENINPHIDCFQTFSDTTYHEVATNILMEGNTCINQDAQTALEKGNGFMIGGGDLASGGASNLIIRNNLIIAYRGLFATYTSNLTITNNTFVGKIPQTNGLDEYGLFLQNVANALIQNNIFYNIVGTSCNIHGGTSNGNLFYITPGEGYLRCSPIESDLWNINPLFINPSAGDYHLQAGSPAIDAGVGGVTIGAYGLPAP